MIIKAREKERDARIFSQWLTQLQWMTKDNFVPFSEYRDSLTGANVDKRNTTDILAELDDVEKQFFKEET